MLCIEPPISEIASTIADTQIEFADSIEGAVDLAGQLARSGDIVLFSPACASYDMFENFQHRGDEFRRIVNSRT